VIQKYPQESWLQANALQCNLIVPINLFMLMNALIKEQKKSLQENRFALLIFIVEITLGWMKL
jgi:hypothetical protein